MRRFPILNTASIVVASLMALGVSAQLKLAPVPIEEAAAARSLTPVPVDLSPDGRWLAYTAEDPKAHPPIEEGGHDFTLTGVPMTWGGGKAELWVTSTTTGETIDLNAQGAMSWGGVWSPDGKKLAFYSDRSGQMSVWVWEQATGRLRQVSAVIARPHFWFELVRWTPDSRKVLCKVLPEGMTLVDAAALLPTVGPRVTIKDWSKPSVFVLDSATKKAAKETNPSSDVEITGGALTNSALGDLALVDVVTGELTRIVRGAKPRWFSVSPDGKHIGITTLLGWEANSQQPVYDLRVYGTEDGQTRVLVPRIRQDFGISVSWSPDGRTIAYLTGGQRAEGGCFLVPVTGGEPRSCSQGKHPSFADEFGSPLWDAGGKTLYFVGGSSVWKTDLTAGTTTEVARVPGRGVAEIVGPASGGRFWSPDGGRSMVVTTRDDESKKAGFYRIELGTGSVAKLLEESKHYGWSSSFDVPDDGRQVVWEEEDGAHPPDFWIQYEMGQARLLEWSSVDGRKLRGTLLLPAGYREGTRYPLVSFVYGGGLGSNDLDRFGLWGSSATFNMQVLATRGYAVFSPDAPLAVGASLRGLADTVLPGINKVIELGIADPDRLAVMGQSYGSYSVLALLVQTTRFKAAVISAVVNSDILGGYVYMNNDGTDGTGYYEEGQGGMGGTPWQYPARYHDNSPIFFFDRIETPLLMEHGAMDSLPLWWPDTTFVALRRLGKKVEYVMYAGEGHVVLGYANTIDFWNRRLAFLQENLAGQAQKANP